MKLNTRELTGTTLLIAYYMAEGFSFQFGAPDGELVQQLADSGCKYGAWAVGPAFNICMTCNHLERPNFEDLITEYTVSIEYPRDGVWVASIWTAGKGYVTAWAESPHTAALRCYIAYKLGDEIEIADAILEALK